MPADAPTPDHLQTRRLLIRLAVSAVAMVGVFGTLSVLLREPLTAFAAAWVSATGLTGMFVAVATFDCVPSPIPPDLFTGFAMMGGVGFWPIVGVATLGSITGGSVAWGVGRRFRQAAWFQRRIAGPWQHPYGLVQRMGTVALVLGALSPLPFSVTCYAAGALNMPYPRFLAVAALRGPRMVLYLGLMKLGWVGLG